MCIRDSPLFTLTATPREHVAMVVKAINNGMGHITDWKTGTVEGTELKMCIRDRWRRYRRNRQAPTARAEADGRDW